VNSQNVLKEFVIDTEWRVLWDIELIYKETNKDF